MSEVSFSLEGEVAVVTGAGRGIGEGIAKVLSGAGASVVCAARRTHEIERVAQEISEGGGQAIAAAAQSVVFIAAGLPLHLKSPEATT